MPRNESGTFVLPSGSIVTNGDTSDATDLNTPLADLEADLNTARPIVAGGTGATSAAGARLRLGIAAEADVATLLANTTFTYSSGASQVTAGNVIQARAEGFSYKVAASGATDHHATTAGGVKLYVQPMAGVYMADAFGLTGDGVADDTVKMQTAVTAAAGKTLRFTRGKTYLSFGVVVLADTVIDLNGATIKHRPTVGGDSGNFSTFSGTTGIYGTTKQYPCMFYIKGGFRMFGNGGTIDGNARGESASYLAGVSGFDFAHGGSHNGSVDRSGIVGTASDGAKPYLEVDGVTWLDMYGESVAVDGCPDTVIRNCVETDGRSLFCNLTGAVESTETSVGSLIFEGNKLNGTRQYNRVPNDLVVGNFDTCVFANNIVDGRDKIPSETPEDALGLPDAGKFQSISELVVSGNLFQASGMKLAAYSGFVGKSLNVTGNQFVFPDANVFNGGGIVGGTAPYANTAVVGNTFANGHLGGLELPTETMLIADNVFTATSSRVATTARDEWAAIYIVNNEAITPGRTIIRGNTFDLGGFDAHCMMYLTTAWGDMRVVDNEITGCDQVHVSATAINATASRMEWSGNRIWNNRSMGRFYFDNVAELSFVGNEFGSLNATAPTTMAGYTETHLRLNLASGAGTWGLVRFAKNFVNDATNTFRITNDTAAGVTISAFIVTDNVWLSSAGGNELFTMLSANAATVPLVIVSGNVFGGDVRLSNVWTVTSEIITGNTFLTSTHVVFNSGGNVAITGDRSTSVGAAGGASALPATPTGYLIVDVNGAARKVPFYAS